MGTNIYSARIQYEYEVRGRRLFGKKICMGGEMDTSFRSRAEARCRRYRPGKTVQVYYNPAKPNLCCLEPTAKLGPLLYAIGGAFVGIGAFLLFFVDKS
jgi:hypothetical protein